VDPTTSPVGRNLAARVQGLGLATYLVALPVLIVQRWGSSFHVAHGGLERLLLVVLGALWCGFVTTVVLAARQLRAGGRGAGGAYWLAGLFLGLVSVLAPAASASAAISSHTTHLVATPTTPATSLSHLSLLLATKRRRQQLNEIADDEVDDALRAMEALDTTPLEALHHFFDGSTAGVASIPDSFVALPLVDDADPVVVCRLGQSAGHTLLGYARRGAVLPIAHEWTANQLREELVGLPETPLVFADSEHQLLRALATQRDRSTVVFTGRPSDIDDELRSLCVCVAATTEEPTQPEPPRVRVLRASPTVVGLVEPFAPAVRRRCVEMVTYLALHDDPVSADRMRSRVLAYADVDASKGTLSNTATAVRRSLCNDERGPRLHPVTVAGLYQLHGVTSDLADFHSLVARARRLDEAAAAPLSRDALRLVEGEPFASVTRGYEWFILEGHLASLQRDGEWAALTLATVARTQGDYETAFWALRQGLLLDPGNATLLDALYAVPRLRQFGGDSAGGTQHQSVSAGGTVAMRWSFQRFRDEVTE